MSAPRSGPRGSTARRLGASAPGRVLACAVLVAGIATAPVDAPRALGAALLAAALVGALLRPDARTLMRRALLVLPVLVALVLPHFVSGAFARGLGVSARALAALFTTLSVAGTLDAAELPGALRSLGLPRTLVAILASMLRQASAVSDQARRIVLARRLRGARGSHVSAEVLASLLQKTAARAERVELAMRLRGGSESNRAREPLRPGDAPAVGVALLCALAIHAAA